MVFRLVTGIGVFSPFDFLLPFLPLLFCSFTIEILFFNKTRTPVKKDDELSPEEIQVNELIKEATEKYGSIEDQIRNLPKEGRPFPRNVPSPVRGYDLKNPYSNSETINVLRDRQQEIIEETKQRAAEISKNCPPEIQEKIDHRVDAWAKSDIYDSYLATKHKTIDEAQDRFSKMISDFKEKQGSSKEKELTDNTKDFPEKSESAFLPGYLTKEFDEQKNLSAKEPDKTDKSTPGEDNKHLPGYLTKDVNEPESPNPQEPDKTDKEPEKDDFEPEKDDD